MVEEVWTLFLNTTAIALGLGSVVGVIISLLRRIT